MRASWIAVAFASACAADPELDEPDVEIAYAAWDTGYWASTYTYTTTGGWGGWGGSGWGGYGGSGGYTGYTTYGGGGGTYSGYYYGGSGWGGGNEPADFDHDGLSDDFEIEIGTDPKNGDTDGDGLADGREIELGTNPLDPDTDDDGVLDGTEILDHSDPMDPSDPGVQVRDSGGYGGSPEPGYGPDEEPEEVEEVEPEDEDLVDALKDVGGCDTTGSGSAWLGFVALGLLARRRS